MPHSRRTRRTALQEQTNVNMEDNGTKERQKIMDKVEALKNNWKVGIESRRKLLEQKFDNFKEKQLAQLDELLLTLPAEIQKMTVSEFISMNSYEKVKKNPMRTSNCLSEVDRKLLNLNAEPVMPVKETTKKTRKPKKKGAPRTTRKNAKKPNPMVTPSTSALPQSFIDTPFMTPLLSLKENAGDLFTPRLATERDLDGLMTKLQLFTARGSPVMIPMDNERIRARMQRIVKQDLSKVAAQMDTSE